MLSIVDLPNRQEREAIWRLQIQRHGRNAREFDTVQLAKETDGSPALRSKPLSSKPGTVVSSRRPSPRISTSPGCSRTSSHFPGLWPSKSQGLRAWAKGRARLASAPPPEARLRKLAVE